MNDPTTFPPPNKSHGSYHWAFERLLAASLLPITGAAFVTSGSAYPVLDGILGVSLVMHSHIGVCPFPCESGGPYVDENWSFFIIIDCDVARGSIAIFFCGSVSRNKFDSLLVDYVHPRKFPKLGPTLTWALRATTVGVLVGVYQFNTEDIGQCLGFHPPLQAAADPSPLGL